jgi:alpha-beta hydrolase superfamily lysophospholipase
MTIESEVSDALVALDFLKNDSQVDSDRIAIFGRSFGGVVAILASHQFATIKSLALWAPVFGCEQWKEKWQKAHSAPMSSVQRESLMNIEGLQPGYSFLQQLFALNLAEQLKSLDKVPMLHIHGEKDAIVDLTHANRFREARHHVLEKSHFKLLPESDHDFLNPTERKIALADTAEWFVKTLCN